MTRTAFRLVLLVSCAHALVHAFELALPSVEQMIGEELVGKTPEQAEARYHWILRRFNDTRKG